LRARPLFPLLSVLAGSRPVYDSLLAKPHFMIFGDILLAKQKNVTGRRAIPGRQD